MNKKQQILYNLMCDFDDICTANDIPYVVIGGTLLGGVRNEGFLPWDDDVDVLVTRKDFVRLNKVMESLDMKDRAWVSQENTPEFLNPISKFFDTSTTLCFMTLFYDGSPNAQHIEVFIADPCPSDPEELSRFKKHLWLCTEIINPYFASGTVDMPGDMLDRELYDHYKAIYNSEGKDAALAAIMKEMDYPEEETENIMIRWSHNPVVFRKEWIQERVWLPYGDRKFPAGKGTIRQLFSSYGENWNLVPPKSARATHTGAVEIQSSIVPYYTKNKEVYEILDEYDYKNVMESYTATSQERILTRFEMQRKVAEMKRSVYQAVIDKWNKKDCTFSRDRLDEYAVEFTYFFDNIFYFYYRKFFLQLDMNPDLLESMVMTLIYQNKTANAINLLKMNTGNPLYEKYMKICEDLQEMKILRYEENLPAVEEILSKIENEYDLADQLETERTRIWLTSVTRKFGSLEEIWEFYENLVNKNDGDIQKYVGDMIYNLGLIKDAHPFYVRALKGNNGVLLTDLRKKGYFNGASMVYPTTISTLELCEDLSNICKENNIPFFFGGSPLRIAASEQFKNFMTVEAYVPAGDMLKLVEIMENNHDSRRALEYVGNNEEYSEMSLKYVDRTTTLINKTDPFEHQENGGYIVIKPILMRYPRTPIKIIRLYIEDKALTSKNLDNPTNEIDKLKKRILKSVKWGVSRYSHERRKKHFAEYCSEFSQEEFGEYAWIKDTRGRYRPVLSSLITDTTDLCLIGYNIRVPKASKDLFRIIYKKRGKVYETNIVTSSHIVNDKVPYEKVERRLEEEEIDSRYFRRIAEQKEEYRSGTHSPEINKVFYEIVDMYKKPVDEEETDL